jgi:hypothetical protein
MFMTCTVDAYLGFFIFIFIYLFYMALLYFTLITGGNGHGQRVSPSVFSGSLRWKQ